jgi:hypothetical protein
VAGCIRVIQPRSQLGVGEGPELDLKIGFCLN